MGGRGIGPEAEVGGVSRGEQKGDELTVFRWGGRTGPKSAGDAMRTQNTHLKNVLVSIMY